MAELKTEPITGFSLMGYETMAELAEEFNTDEFIKKVSRENQGMASKIHGFIERVIERIKNAFGKNKGAFHMGSRGGEMEKGSGDRGKNRKKRRGA